MAALSDFPNSFNAGDGFAVTLSEPGYAAPDYTLSFAAHAGISSINLSATGTGTSHAFAALPTATAQWKPGSYAWKVYATYASGRETIAQGVMTVLPNFAAAPVESHARKTLRMIEAQIEGRVEDGLDSATINGQSITLMSSTDLRAWLAIYLGKVAAEDGKTAGRGGARVHRVRFVCPR